MLNGERVRSPKNGRKRAPTAGAANDCFTCQELRRMCDRGRPYCTQCLEHGKDCSGYKTALTWNIGVASRGKLRGLALPIAPSEQCLRQSIARGRKRWTKSDHLAELGSERSNIPHAPTSQPSHASAEVGTKQYSFVIVDPDHAAKSFMSDPIITRSHSASQWEPHAMPRARKRLRPHSSEPSLGPASDQPGGYEDFEESANLMGLRNDHCLGRSVEYSPSASFVAAYEQHYNVHSDSLTNIDPSSGGLCMLREPMEWLPGDCSAHSSDERTVDYPNHRVLLTVPPVTGTSENFPSCQQAFDDYGFAINDEKYGHPGEHDGLHVLARDQTMHVCGQNGWPEELGASQLHSFAGEQTHNLPFLIDYFDKVIPPLSTTYSSPSTLYKSYILRLAVTNGALQYAIAALSATYMRQKRRSISTRTNRSKESPFDFFYEEGCARKYRSEHHALDARRNQAASCSQNEIEEECYKEASLNLLNDQLAVLNRTKDDSTAATFLVLSLYQVCGMGVAVLEHHFAGMMMRLSLQEENSTLNLKISTWLAVMFTWLDPVVLPDGEDKAGANINISSINDETWALDGLAGPCGKLFNIVTKLRRLNLAIGGLPNKRDVLLQGGFGGIPSTVDEGYDLYNLKQIQADRSRAFSLVDTEMDPRATFWRQWNEARAELQGWQVDTPLGNSSSFKAALFGQVTSSHESESFRYAALLYMELLAEPGGGGMRPHVQTLVMRLRHHVSKVEVELSLLSPLFIAGLGPHIEQKYHLIPGGCWDMQEKSDFLKNVPTFELLRHLWGNDEDSTSAPVDPGRFYWPRTNHATAR